MEEKERYELFGEYRIKDNNPDARCQLLNTYQAYVILNEQDKENQQLKQQLAEKERQVKKLNNEAQKYFEDAYCNDFHNQDKISFCIEKIQEIKNSLRDKVCLMGNDTHCYLQNAIHWQDVVAIIDNQIEELKKGVK